MVKSVMARDFMVTKLITLRPDMDVFEAIALLLKNHISGAPVLDHAANRAYVGVFSEKCSMSVITGAAYDQLPSNIVGAFVDRDALTISPDTDLLSIVQIFATTNYRRLPVLEEGQLVGQVSRRDVIRASLSRMHVPPGSEKSLLYLSALVERTDSPIT